MWFSFFHYVIPLNIRTYIVKKWHQWLLNIYISESVVKKKIHTNFTERRLCLVKFSGEILQKTYLPIFVFQKNGKFWNIWLENFLHCATHSVQWWENNFFQFRLLFSKVKDQKRVKKDLQIYIELRVQRLNSNI